MKHLFAVRLLKVCVVVTHRARHLSRILNVADNRIPVLITDLEGVRLLDPVLNCYLDRGHLVTLQAGQHPSETLA